jgi:hypothetical protein
MVQAQTLSAPVLGKRSRSPDPDITDFPWLKEVREKIWSQKDRRREIFRKVNVAQADYIAHLHCKNA